MRVHNLHTDGTAVRFESTERVPIRPESTLEDWIHYDPSLVFEEPLLLIARQARLDTGVADLLAVDQFGNVVVIEVKIGKSGTGSASEETILSQPQAYARSLSEYEYEQLDALYEAFRNRLTEDEWHIDPQVPEAGTLSEAFAGYFGDELAPHEFNIEQRMVVVAEEVTRQTELNMHYLLEQGLHYQAVELQRFVRPDCLKQDSETVATSIVVDYDLQRVRPAQRSAPTYPQLTKSVVGEMFDDVRGVVKASSVGEVFPDGFDNRGALLRSHHFEHPQGVVYGLAVKPDQGEVILTLDNLDDDPDVLEQIQANNGVFEDAGFEVKDNLRYRLVEAQWSVESTEEVRSIRPEIADQYVILVKRGHEVLASD